MMMMLCSLLVIEFEEKKQNAVSKHERLQQDAQAVLNVIEKPEVAQALRQDKNQNLQYLRDNHQVCCSTLNESSCSF